MNVAVKNQANNQVTFEIPVAGFGRAFDGPPVDPKVLEEQQKKLQEELQKRAEEERKRLEAAKSGQGAGARSRSRRPERPLRLLPRRRPIGRSVNVRWRFRGAASPRGRNKSSRQGEESDIGASSNLCPNRSRL